MRRTVYAVCSGLILITYDADRRGIHTDGHLNELWNGIGMVWDGICNQFDRNLVLIHLMIIILYNYRKENKLIKYLSF